jgi:dihydrofolate reductase
MFHQFPVVIVAGMSKQNRAIGNKNGLLWHVPDDLKRFKELTLGKPIIMGRKTFESIVAILGKPLPGRTNIVVTRNTDYKPEGAHVVHTLEEGLALAASENPTEIHIGGGAEMYVLAFPYVDTLHLTLFDDTKEGDTYFPDFTSTFTETERHGTREHNGITYEWVDYKRK